MKRLFGLCLAFSGISYGATYEVTITNLMTSQVLSPPVMVSHPLPTLFQLGMPATRGLRLLAEEGQTDELVSELNDIPGVGQVVVGEAIMPGEAKVFTITADALTPNVSIASMLSTTNDGFTALPGGAIYPQDEVMFQLKVYDAGTEFNSELCSFIPGPPCGSAGARDASRSEGMIADHPGLQGVGNLDATLWGWGEYAATVAFKKIAD